MPSINIRSSQRERNIISKTLHIVNKLGLTDIREYSKKGRQSKVVGGNFRQGGQET